MAVGRERERERATTTTATPSEVYQLTQRHDARESIFLDSFSVRFHVFFSHYFVSLVLLVVNGVLEMSKMVRPKGN